MCIFLFLIASSIKGFIETTQNMKQLSGLYIDRKSENVAEIGPSPLCKRFYGESAAKSYHQANNREGEAVTLHRR